MSDITEARGLLRVWKKNGLIGEIRLTPEQSGLAGSAMTVELEERRLKRETLRLRSSCINE